MDLQTARQLVHSLLRHAAAWRVVAVVAAVGVGLYTDTFRAAREQLYVLKFLALVAVSVFSGSWPMLAGGEILLGLSWLLVVRRGGKTLASRLIVDVNRLVGHVEALGPCIVLAMLLEAPAALRFGAVAALIAWGPKALNWLVAQVHLRRTGQPPSAAWVARARRVPMYGVTVVGTLVLVLLAPGQWRALAPSALAVLLGMAVRLWATFQPKQRNPGLTERQWGQILDAAAAILVVALAGYGAWILARPKGLLAFGPRVSAAQCQVGPAGQQGLGGPAAAPQDPVISLFLVADTQFHELRGQRSAAHLPMVDAVVPVAVRPVALDLLSGVTLDQFARIYGQYARRYPATQHSWAFLGDLADIGCSTELERYPSYFQRFEAQLGRRSLAGIASGNHDNTFVGNFVWHPDWDSACQVGGRGHRLDKPAADAALRSLVERFGQPGTWMAPEPVQGWVAHVEGRAALPMVAKLGDLPAAGGKTRPVVGVFLDTGDSALWQFGVAGSQGNVSEAQLQAVTEQVPAEALVVLLLHHPTEQLGPFSRRRLGELAETLGKRLMLVVSAHTHRSAFHRQVRLGDVRVAEVTVGSTTDPTQEAAILEIRGTAEAPRVQARVVPAVRRSGMDCSDLSDVDATACVAELAGLASGCTEVTEDDFRVRLSEPDEMTEHQRQISEKLMNCVDVPMQEDTLDPEAYTAAARRDPAVHRRLLCLSWAASILQGKKGEGWRYADAVRCAGERGSTLGGFAVEVPVGPQAPRRHRPVAAGLAGP